MGLLINIDMVKLILLLAFFCVGCSDAFNEGSEKIVYNGIPWFDDQGNKVNDMVPVSWKTAADIIFSGNINRTKAMPFRDSVATLRMIW